MSFVHVTNDNCVGGVQTMTRLFMSRYNEDKHIYIFDQNLSSLFFKYIYFFIFIFRLFLSAIVYKRSVFIFSMWPVCFLSFIPIILGRKVVVCIHSFIELERSTVVWFLKCICNFAPLSKRITICSTSESIHDRLRFLGIHSAAKMSVVAFGDRPKSFYRKPDSNTIRIAWVGRNDFVKDIFFLPSVINVISRSYSSCEVYVFGVSDLDWVKNKPINVTYFPLGYESFSKSNIPLDILVNTSITENAPISVLEALAKGMIVIAPPLGEILLWSYLTKNIVIYDKAMIDSFRYLPRGIVHVPVDFLSEFTVEAQRHVLCRI